MNGRSNNWQDAHTSRVSPSKVIHLRALAFQTDTTRVRCLALGSDEVLFPGVVTVGYEQFDSMFCVLK